MTRGLPTFPRTICVSGCFDGPRYLSYIHQLLLAAVHAVVLALCTFSTQTLKVDAVLFLNFFQVSMSGALQVDLSDGGAEARSSLSMWRAIKPEPGRPAWTRSTAIDRDGKAQRRRTHRNQASFSFPLCCSTVSQWPASHNKQAIHLHQWSSVFKKLRSK
jgi:hypothetical protein